MEITNELPEWYGKDLDGGGYPIPFARLSLSTFSGRFGLTKEKTLSEIVRCKLWTCEPDNSMKLTLGQIYGIEPTTIPVAELDRYAAIINEELTTEKKRHIIQPVERKSKAKSVIQLAISEYLDATPSGMKAGFYDFLKAKIQLTANEILKNGEGYEYYFKSVTTSGSKEGVYLNMPKEGKKEGESGYNHYAGAEITTLISREKGNRKK
jgi:hypothetical protein